MGDLTCLAFISPRSMVFLHLLNLQVKMLFYLNITLFFICFPEVHFYQQDSYDKDTSTALGQTCTGAESHPNRLSMAQTLIYLGLAAWGKV